MRTTVTIDPQVEQLLRQAMQTRGQSFKQVLNSALRKGLADVEHDAREPRFEVHARPMHLRAGVDPARLNALADDLEMQAHAELTSRLLDESTRNGRP